MVIIIAWCRSQANMPVGRSAVGTLVKLVNPWNVRRASLLYFSIRTQLMLTALGPSQETLYPVTIIHRDVSR